MLPLGSSEPPSSSKVSAPPVPPAHGTKVFRSPSPPPNSAPVPDRLDAESRAFRKEIEQRLAGGDESYYEILGVAEDADEATIHQSFLTLAKKWHPDRLGPDFVDVREAVTRVFARMSEAQQNLCDPAKRKEYDRRGRHAEQDAEEAEHVQRVLRAATAFQRAEILLRRGSLAQAEEEARSALADDPSQPEYRALLAWLEAQKPGAEVTAGIAVLDKVINQAPNDTRARWYRGQLYKRSGRDNRAIRDFRAIVEQDPRNVDAQREIRLYEMRNAGRIASDRPSDLPPGRASKPPDDRPKSPEGGPSGLFKRIFKR
jgi:curved DNA-binding protein CbpA